MSPTMADMPSMFIQKSITKNKTIITGLLPLITSNPPPLFIFELFVFINLHPQDSSNDILMKKVTLMLILWMQATILLAQSPIQEAMSNYEYEKALTLIGQEASTLPLLYQKGDALRALGRYEEAQNVFLLICSQDSLNPRAYIKAAEGFKHSAQTAQALQYYQKAIALNPQNKYARIQYITLLLSMKHYQDALTESTQLLQADSSLHLLHLQAEALEHCSKESNLSIQAYQNIRRLYPKDYLSAAKLGNLFIGEQRYAEAIEVTEEFRKQDSTNLIVNRINAQAYALRKEYPTAIKRYHYLLQQKDSSFMTCFYAGISYYAMEEFYPAHDLLLHASKENANNVNLLYYLGRACAKTQWRKEGIEYLQKAIRLTVPEDSTVAQLYVGLTEYYKMAHQYQQQVNTILKHYRDYAPHKHKLLYDAAYVYYFPLRNDAKAKQCLEAYLKTRPQTETKEPAENQEVPTLTEENRYNAAERWLADIKKKEKKEAFFKGEVEAE